jgi:hypothetical protein
MNLSDPLSDVLGITTVMGSPSWLATYLDKIREGAYEHGKRFLDELVTLQREQVY